MNLESRIEALESELKELRAQASAITKVKIVEHAEIVYYIEVVGETTEEALQDAFKTLSHGDSDEIITKNVVFEVEK